MSAYTNLLRDLKKERRKFVVTGAAGFIGSHISETLLNHGQEVVAVDNLATGHRRNIDLVREATDPGDRLTFLEADINDTETMRKAFEGSTAVIHQAALGSVPRSIEQPLNSHHANVNGFISVLDAARQAGIKRVVYASSSSVYGDAEGLPKVEHIVGDPLSPYAATKAINEVYAKVYQRCYDMELIGFRYFNVFGPRQDPDGAYAAVIPKWTAKLLKGVGCEIYGDGETSRDFCYVDNAVQANLLGAMADHEATNKVYNIAFGQRTSLNELFQMICDGLKLSGTNPDYKDFRPGDVRHSLADISLAQKYLHYEPSHDVHEGMREALSWYVESVG